MSAPIAFTIARSVQRGVAAIQGAAGSADADGGPPVALVGLVKAVEYDCLGLLVGWLGRRSQARALQYILVGLAVGVVFGSMVLATQGYINGQMPDAKMVSPAVNELLFPAGCALVIYIGTALGKRAAAKSAPTGA